MQLIHPTSVFDPTALQRRREEYFAFVRGKRTIMFRDDGQYQPTTERDGRIAYWALPAFLSSPESEDHAFGLRCYAAAAGWNAFDIFMTSCTAANYVHFSARFSPELRLRSEEHLARFTIADDGRAPSAAIYDYSFHGYNDNMPALATRTMIFAGDILDRTEYIDAGLFNLAGLCAHFERRGLLSEYTSATYTPLTVNTLLDIAEHARLTEAREMAQACANRILLDILGHWHWGTGTTGGAMSRAYTADLTESLSVLNVYLWYLSGHPLTINPCEALNGSPFAGTIHHGGNLSFNLAQFVEVMHASHAGVPEALRVWATTPHPSPYRLHATTDWGQSGTEGGSRGYLTRTYQTTQWWVGTAAESGAGSAAGQQLVFHSAFATIPQPKSWRDRVAVWHRLLADAPDQGDVEVTQGSFHAGASTTADLDTQEMLTYQAAVRGEVDNVMDWGRYHTAQKGGSVMGLGALAPDLDGRTVSSLRFQILFNTRINQPDEIWENDTPLTQWEGEAAERSWQFLRFGDVYVAVRLSGMAQRRRMPVRRVRQNDYLRIETPLIDGDPVTIDAAFRMWTEYGYLFEIASRDEVGDFAAFRHSVLATTWEYFHSFYRNSRYLGRHGDLHIVDSVIGSTARFIAIDGQVEEQTFFSATGMPAELLSLFPDGKHLRPSRIAYRPEFVASPFYDLPWQVLEADVSREVPPVIKQP